MRPCSDFASDVEAQQSLHGLVRERLRDFGIILKAPKRRVFPVTPMRHPLASKKVFGKALRDLAPNSVVLEGSEVIVPHFLSSIIDYLRRHKDTEGLFRKAGSTARQKSLRAEIESVETFCAENESFPGNIALDAASLLKQWIRELPEPIIPYKVHEALLQSSSRLSDPAKTEAILTCCLLLPPLNASCLALLVRFLLEIAESKEVNKMDSHSLAIVFTPCLFTVEEEASFSKSNQNRNISLNSKLEVVEILINNAKKVCMIDDTMEMALNIPADFASPSEDNLDEGLEGQAGPSARRRKKKKRRSGSLSRVLSATMKGIRKTISRSATPSGPRTQMVDGSSVMRTPFEFSSPAVAPSAKRRATDRAESPNKKSALDVSMTPQVVRNRSISIKNRFKRKKSPAGSKAKGSLVFSIGGPTTPLPNKATRASLKMLSATTPLSSFSLENLFPSGGQDLSFGNLEASQLEKAVLDEQQQKSNCEEILNCLSLEGKDLKERLDKENSLVDYRTPSLPTCGSSSSASSSQTSISSNGGERKRQSAEKRRHRSPSERKIGVVHRRSQEMTRRGLHGENAGSFELPDEIHIKSNLQRGSKTRFDRSRLIPVKSEPIENLITRVQIAPGTNIKECSSSKKYLNESLTNLRQDLSSLIESSFGYSSDKSSTAIPSDSGFGAPLQKTTEPSPHEKSVIPITLPTNLTSNDWNSSNLCMHSSVTRSGLMRRQSSAFDFTRPASEIMKSMNGVSNGSIRRQSSAFEIAAKTRYEPIYEKFEHCSIRASLTNRNSSVKNLVKRLEASVTITQGESKLETDRRRSVSTTSLSSNTSSIIPLKPLEQFAAPLPVPPSIPAQKVEPIDVVEPDPFEEQWVDASEFFGGKSASIFQMNDEAPSGCKRSSIIRMRKEKKGIVSKAVETFTKPALPQNPHTPFKHPPSRTAASTPGNTNPRRTSARMGVATTVRTSNVCSPGHVPAKRQTLTGIRTTPQHAIRRPLPTSSKPVETLKSSETPNSPAVHVNVKSKPNEAYKKGSVNKSRGFSDKDHNKVLEAKIGFKNENGTSNLSRKSKRLEGRRHLTIGYEGEVRSPLRERQNNLAATVQRSKSAQTANPKIAVCKRPKSIVNNSMTPTKEILRSQSLRANPGIVVPRSLKETVYDVTTPRSERVRRNLSDRIMTPTGGRHEAIPFIKSALSQSRAKGTPLRHGHVHNHGASPYLTRSPPKQKSRF